MTTSTNDTTITACYGTCTDNEFCPAFDLIDVTFAVNMQYEQLDETGVFLHGGWFGWGTMAMSDDDANGVYEITIPDMTSGSTIEFKFMNGDLVEDVPAECENINDWGGGINRMYTLPSENTTIGPICFGGCVDCAPAGPVDVTFNVDMSGVDGFDGTEAPYVFGSFNDWDSFGSQTMLADEDGDNIYTGTVDDLMSDTEITLLFGYGASYETVPEECGILDSELALYVRLLPIQDAGGSDVLVLDAISYGGCPQLNNEESSDNVMPAEFSYKMFPNPFNPYINIYYELPVSELVTITIMNLLGQEVKTIVNKVHQPGRYSNSWDGKDSYGQVLQSGIYFAVINRQSGRAVSKITFLK
jgi:hypothetical protein